MLRIRTRKRETGDNSQLLTARYVGLFAACYDGPLTVPDAFETALSLGPRSTQFTALVHVLTTELRNLCRLEESVCETASPDDASTFILELSSFLKELGCPYLCLVTGHLSSRLQKKSDRLLLLDYLLSELMAVRMVAIDKPQEQTSAMDVTIHETPTAKDLKDILSALKMSAPPPNISVSVLFQKLKEKLTIVLQQQGPDYAGRPLYNQALTEKQWKEMEELHKKMVDEYRLRREMLITRLDCTIQSFEWQGDKGNKNERIEAVFRPLRQKMKTQSAVRLSDFLAARNNLLAVTKTSDAAVRIHTKSRVNTHIIGKVPDRGGRPSEQQAPPPEMPSWQNQRSQGGGRGGQGGSRGGGPGGRGGSGFGGPGGKVQGGWNPQPADQRSRGGGQGLQQDNRNNYQDNSRGHRGGYSEGRGGNRGGFNDGNQGGYSNRGGYDNRGGTQGGNSAGNQYQDNRTNQGGYDNNRRNSGGYQSQAAYQPPDLQHSQSLDAGNQSKGRYQNEHDDRSNTTNYSRGGSAAGRGRSVYNRGGRN